MELKHKPTSDNVLEVSPTQKALQIFFIHHKIATKGERTPTYKLFGSASLMKNQVALYEKHKALAGNTIHVVGRMEQILQYVTCTLM
jgi:hypothetical protein